VVVFGLFWYLVGRRGWQSTSLELFLVIVGLLLGLWMRPAFRVNAVLMLISLGMSIYAGEVVFAVGDHLASAQKGTQWLPFNSGEEHADERAIVANTSVISFDRRSRLEVLRDLRNKSIDAWPAIGPQVLFRRSGASYQDPLIKIEGVSVLPLGGISTTTTVYCNENGYYVIYESDEHGFQNPKGLWSVSPLDIAVIGDSYVHGACVKPETNFASLIRQRYSRTLNLGGDGNGPLLELATLKEYVPPLRPRVVVWCYFEMNDMWELDHERQTFLTNYLTPGYTQGLIAKQPEIDRALKEHVERVWVELNSRASIIMFFDHILDPFSSSDEFEQLIKLWHIRSHLTTFLKPEGERQAHRPVLTLRWEDIDLFGKTLSDAKTTVAGWGGTLVFVYLPQYERYANPELVNEDRRDLVLRIVRSLNLPLIDLTPTFAAQADPLNLFPFRRAGHYNENGHRVVAEEVLKFLGDMHLESRKKNDPTRSRPAG
jgi:hypothetical protein